MSLHAVSRWYQGTDGVVFEHCRKARKEHVCDVCRNHIEPGEDYRAVWSPECFTAALHTSCADLIDQLHVEMDLRDDEGISYNEAADLAKQCGYTFDLTILTWEKGVVPS